MQPTETFTYFDASWATGSEFPAAWYTQQEYKKPGIFAFFWTPTLDIYKQFEEQNNSNARELMELMKALGAHNLKNFELHTHTSSGAFTRQDAFDQLDRLKDLKNGDSCFIFYSGIGMASFSSTYTSDAIAEPLFAGDDWNKQTLQALRTKLREYIEGKEVHVFSILDYRVVIRGASSLAPFYTPHGASLVVLENAPLVVEHIDADQPIPADNFFFEQIEDLVHTTGAKMRYAHLVNRLQLRYLTAGRTTGKPRCIGFPETTMQAYIISGVFTGKSDYRVYYNEEMNQWQINAGKLNGILPSLDFMHTIFHLDDGRRVSIDKTFDSYSTLLDFEEPDTENTFEAQLVQTALSKMKLGYHPALSPGMKARFEEEVQRSDIYFIDIVDNMEEIRFLIKNRNEEYYLVRNGEYMGQPDDRPVFFYQQYPFEFIKQLEYIAQWEALLELENSRSNINTDKFEVQVEIIEGTKGDIMNTDMLPGTSHINPDELTLRYRNGRKPLFRCNISNIESTDTTKYYIVFLYLGCRFGIHRLNSDEEILDPLHKVWASAGKSRKRSMQLKMDDFYIENGITEIQDFLMIAASTHPMDVSPLTQEELEPSQNLVRKGFSSVGAARHSFVLPEGDWAVKKIPIRIIYDDRSFEQTVNDLVGNRPITVPGDLQKNRWGGKASKNGFTLSAQVTKTTLDLFKVTLEVRHATVALQGEQVAFLLHDSFTTMVNFKEFESGLAQVEVTAYEDFTAAAIVYDGTELELDLSEIPGLPEKFYAENPWEKFKKQVEAIVQSTPVQDPKDVQKGRWGGRAADKGYELKATVQSGANEALYDVTLEVVSENKASAGKVAFLLPDSFSPSIRIRDLKEGTASLKITASKDFTVAAIPEDGARLELELSKLQGLPDAFYENSFEHKVAAVVQATGISVPHDLQKNRWGGLSERNGKRLDATVTANNDTHHVTLTVQSTTDQPLEGMVAFLLHDSFDEHVKFSKVHKGIATCTINSYEAFTVGAYTSDGTQLEIDLNTVTGFPASFYY